MNIVGNFMSIGQMLIYLAVAFIAILVSGRVLTALDKPGSGITAAGSNVAAGIRYGGLFVAIGIGLSGVFAGSSRGFISDLTTSVIYGGGLVVVMIVALKINDWLVLPVIDNSDEIAKGNVAVAAVEFGSMIATGLIAKGAVMGESGGWQTSIVFFLLGQSAMVLLVYVYERIRESQYSLVQEVGRGSVAAGIVLGGKLWAYGLIMAAAVAGNFTGWSQDIGAFVITAVAGMIFLYIAEWLIDLLILTRHTVKEVIDGKHMQPALLLAGGKVGMAYVISTVAL